MRGLLKATVAVLLAPAVELVFAAVPELVSTVDGKNILMTCESMPLPT